ncbi:MAG TPA: universal stress protein [Anaerolineales bacterium]|nr:universal stress protein [Anaerolineales bacterium]
MSATERIKDIQRILVALDASPQSLAALEVAAELAAKYEAELIAVFVEDINLVRLAEFPFAQEIGNFSAISRQLESQHIERELRAHARWVERITATIAKRTNLRWSFHTTRGAIPGELLSAALESDLIILGKTGWSGHRQLGSTARSLVVQAPLPTLFLKRSLRSGVPVMVAFEDSPSGRKALAIARLLRLSDNPFTVLVLATDLEEANRLQSEAQSMLEPAGILASYRWLSDMDGQKLARLPRLEGCEVMVLPADSQFFSEDILLSMVNETDCAVLLVR